MNIQAASVQGVFDADHSPIGASGAHRYLACPGAVKASYGRADEPSDYAMEGTIAHHVGEVCLREGKDAWEFHGDVFGEIIVNDDMVCAVQSYVDFCRSIMLGSTGPEWIEEGVTVNSVHPFLHGTVDFASSNVACGHLDVVDFKYGVGIAVDADGNPQGRIYAMGILEAMENASQVEEINISIVQPRAVHSKGPIRTETIPVTTLLEWRQDVLIPGLEASKQDDAPRKSGPHCRFCPARSDCYQLLNDIMDPWTEFGATDPDKLSNEDLGSLLTTFERLGILKAALTKEALGRLTRGGEVPNVFLKAKGTHRKLKKGAEAHFKKKFGNSDDMFEDRKLKTPAALEKLSPEIKAEVAEWAQKPDGGYSLAFEGDDAPKISRKASDIFKGKTKD